MAFGLSAKRASRERGAPPSSTAHTVDPVVSTPIPMMLSRCAALSDVLVRRAMSIHQGKTKTAVLELGLREPINAHQRRKLS